MTEEEPNLSYAQLFWTRRSSLTVRILAVNILALALMAGSLFYLDSYRKQLLEERFKLARSEATIVAEALAGASPEERRVLLAKIGAEQHLRLRLFAPDGRLEADSFALGGPSFELIDPRREPWVQHVARGIDRAMNLVLGTRPAPIYRDRAASTAADWPELAQARLSREAIVIQRRAPDQTPVITAAVPVGGSGESLLSLRNARDITLSVRDARGTLAILLAIVLFISVQLSLFLARTIVRPLRMLVRAAVRVRLGRDREVVVPRMSGRRDEIGLLARAVSDMTTALRQRIDGVEAFAADVAHELKNPLASLRSALESMGRVSDPELRRQLMEIAEHDVHRLDRLVSEISEASRIDAELSRATFASVDLHALAEALVGDRARRGTDAGRRITLAKRDNGPFLVEGAPAQLGRVIENLLDNAVSFSPPDGVIAVVLSRHGEWIRLEVLDQGPGIPPSEREKVFERFHSLRPADEAFGRHSGLGLAIARSIAEAHDGSLVADERRDGRRGARLVLELPASGR